MTKPHDSAEDRPTIPEEQHMTETTPAETSPVWRDDNLQPADRLAAIRKRHAVLAARTWEATPHQHGASGCRCLSCYDDPTGWQIDHPAALDCEELVATTSNDFGRKRGSCDARPLLSYDEADALARAADDIGFLLDLAAATVPASAPTGQAALRQRVIDALYEARRPGLGGMTEADAVAYMADAVLARLLGPIPSGIDVASWTAIRAIQLMNEVGEQTEAYRLALSQALGLGTGANWEAIRDRGRDVVAEVAELTQAVRRAASSPGGAAGETQQAEPVRHAPGKAILCPDCRAKGYTVCMEPRVASQPTEPEAAVAYQSTGGQLLRCLAHKPGRLSLDLGCFHPVASEGLPDGGLCTFQVSDTAVCGRDVLIAQPSAVSQPGKEAYTVCLCGHSQGEHIAVSDRLLCDTCDPDSTDNRTCDGFEEL